MNCGRLYVNFFQPSFKLKSKTREGAKVTKKYHAPATPHERLLADCRVTSECKEQLRQTFSNLDPVHLLSQIREARRDLANHDAGGGTEKPAETSLELTRSLRAWPQRGSTAKFAPPIAITPGHGNGALAPIHSKIGLLWSSGSTNSPTQTPVTSFNGSGHRCLDLLPVRRNCELSSAASKAGELRLLGASFSAAKMKSTETVQQSNNKVAP